VRRRRPQKHGTVGDQPVVSCWAGSLDGAQCNPGRGNVRGSPETVEQAVEREKPCFDRLSTNGKLQRFQHLPRSPWACRKV